MINLIQNMLGILMIVMVGALMIFVIGFVYVFMISPVIEYVQKRVKKNKR